MSDPQAHTLRCSLVPGSMEGVRVVDQEDERRTEIRLRDLRRWFGAATVNVIFLTGTLTLVASADILASLFGS